MISLLGQFHKVTKARMWKRKIEFYPHTHTNKKGKMLTRGTNYEQKTERPLVKS